MENKSEIELQVLLEEYERLRQDRRNWDNNIFHLFGLLLTISAVCVTALIQVRSNSVVEESFWKITVIAYPYVIYIFSLAFLILSGAIVHNSAYLIVMEKKINLILGKAYFVWEDTVVRESFYKTNSTYLIASLFMSILLIVLTILCILQGISFLYESQYLHYYIYSNVIIMALLILILRHHFFSERGKAREKIEKAFVKKVSE